MEPLERATSATPSKSSLAPDQQSKIKQAAAALKKKDTKEEESTTRRARYDDAHSTKTNSMLTMGLQSEAGPAMKWMGAYDKNAIRAQYLGDAFAGRGTSREDLLLRKTSSTNINGDGASSINTPAPPLSPEGSNFPTNHSTRDLSALPPLPAEQASNLGAQSYAPVIMPPASPEVNTIPADAQRRQQEAERVPVPEVATPSAMEKELAVDSPGSPKLGRKPLPRADMPAHPAFRQRSVDEPSAPQTPTSPTQNIAAIAAQRAMERGETSPESTKSGHSKLKKRDAAPTSGGGLKKLFGRKKDHPNRQSIDVSNNGPNTLAPPEEHPSRRISLRRKKPSPAETPKDSQVDISQPIASELEA